MDSGFAPYGAPRNDSRSSLPRAKPLYRLRVVSGACAGAMRGKGRLVILDEGHAVGRGIATSLAIFAARERLDGGQEPVRDEIHGLAQPFAIDRERRMHVETVASAGAGRVGAGKPGVAVGHVHDAREISAHERLERRTRAGEIPRQLALENGLRVPNRSDNAALAEQAAFRSRLDH